MKLTLYRIGFWLWFITRGYYLWSKLWRFLLEWKYRKQVLTPYVNIGQLESALAKMIWVEDPLWGAFDIISSPKKVEYILREHLLTGGKPEVGDCDEFAQYAATCIQSMIDRKKTTLTMPEFMTINWLDSKGGFHGHNICVFSDTGGWSHMGNWFQGKVQSGPGDGTRFRNPRAIAEWMATRGKLIAYARATPDLKLKEVHLG